MKIKKGKFFEASKLVSILIAISFITILFSAFNVRAEDPTQTGEAPTNGATGLRLTPDLYVTCIDNDTVDTMNATWWSNSSGDWVLFATNNTGFANNTNITQNNANFSAPGTTYWWRVNLSDGGNSTNTNYTYNFTTDGTPPSVTIEYGSSATYFKAGQSLTVFANFTEAGSGISESTVKISVNYAGSGPNVSEASMNKTDNLHWSYVINPAVGSGNDGTFAVMVNASDNVSLSVSQTDSSKKVDNTAPTVVAIGYSSSSTYYKDADTVTVYVNFTETGSGIAGSTVKITINTTDTDVNSFLMTGVDNTHWTYSWDVPSGSDGNVNVSVDALDNMSFLLSGTNWSVSKYIDNTAPLTSVDPVNASGYWKIETDNSTAVTSTVSDTLSGIATVALYYYWSNDNSSWGGAALFGTDSTPWPASWNFNFLNGSGYYRFYSRGTDNASNVETAPAINDTECGFDTAYPNSTIGAPADSSYYNSLTNITGTATDDYSGLSNVRIAIFNSTDGKYWNGTGWSASPIPLACNGTTSWYYENTNAFPTWASGKSYVITSNATDLAGNNESVGDVNTFIFDDTSPTVSIEYGSSATYFQDANTVTIYANLTETTSGINESTVKINIDTSGTDVTPTAMTKVNNTHWTYSWDVPSGSDGNVNVSVEARANSSLPLSGTNWSVSKYIDNTAPTVSIGYGSSATYFGDNDTVTIFANFTEAGSGILESTVKINIDTSGTDVTPTAMTKVNNTHWTYSWNVPSGSDGNVNVSIAATDNMSFSVPAVSNYSTAKYIDNTNPTLSIGYTGSATYFRDADTITIYANFTEAGSGILESTVKINIDTSGTDVTPTAMTKVNNTHWTYSWNVPSGSDGNVNVSVEGRDNVSLSPLLNWSVSKYIDNTAPTVSVSIPVNSSWYSSLVNISGTAVDTGGSGVSNVNITIFNLTGNTGNTYWNGSVWTTWNYTTSWLGTNGTTSWYNSSGIPSWASGSTYIVNATATDNVGNVGTKVTNHFLFDTLSSISPGSPTTSSATITWTTSANTSSSVEYGLSTSYGSSSSDATYTTSHSIPLTGLSSASTYHYRVTSVDAFGNSNTSSDHTFDTATGGSSPPPSPPSNPPTADASGPYTGTVGTAVQFDGSASTAASGKTISSYSWNFGDGSTGTGATTTHTYTTAGTYTVRLTVTDNQGATDSDSTTATISALPELPSETVSDQTMNEINEDYGVTLEEPFYANDTNGDGIVDTFTDPNNVLTNVNNVDINGNASFLISTNGDNIPEFFWDTTTNAITAVTHAPPQATADPVIDTEEETITINITVNKSNWIYIDVSDAYPDYILTVKTSDGRTISEDMIWRENGKIYVLDDPDTIYDFLYGYIIAPTFSPITVTTFDTSKPTITITYQEQVTITTALFGTNDIIDQITPTDGMVFTFTAGSDIADGTYTLSITAVDGQGNTLESTATYTIKKVSVVTTPAPTEMPWPVIIAIALAIIIILAIIGILFKTGYLYLDQEPAEEPKEEKIEILKEEPTETKKKPTKPKKK